MEIGDAERDRESRAVASSRSSEPASVFQSLIPKDMTRTGRHPLANDKICAPDYHLACLLKCRAED
jgi:hypothetical protein